MKTSLLKFVCLGMLALVGLMLSRADALAQTDAPAQAAIKIGLDNWPPFADEKDPTLGICYTLTKAIFEPQGYRLLPKILPATRIIHYMEEGDVKEVEATPLMWKSEERAKSFLFSEPLLFNSVHFFVKADRSIEYETLDQLKPYAIGVIRGYYNGDEFDKAEFLDKVICADSLQMIRMLEKGRIDMGVLDRVVAETLIKQENLAGAFNMLPKPLFRVGLHLAVSKKHPNGQKLIDQFNQGLERIKQSGEYARILASYGVSE